MTAAFQVILEAEEDDNRPRLKNLECSEIGIFALHTSTPPPASGSTRPHNALQVVTVNFIHHYMTLLYSRYCREKIQYRFTRTDAHKSNMASVAVFVISVTPTAKAMQRFKPRFQIVIRKTEKAR